MAAPPVYKNAGTFATPGRHTVEGSFTTKDGDAPTVVTGAGFTVGAPATAVYTVTGTPSGTGKFAACIRAHAQLRTDVSNSSQRCYVRAVTTSTDPWTATIVTQSSAGTAATLSGPIIDFEFVFRNTEALK